MTRFVQSRKEASHERHPAGGHPRDPPQRVRRYRGGRHHAGSGSDPWRLLRPLRYRGKQCSPKPPTGRVPRPSTSSTSLRPRCRRRTATRRLLKTYLSRAHVQQAETGCPVAALGSEMPRQAPEVRSAATRRIKDMIDLVARYSPDGQPARRAAQGTGDHRDHGRSAHPRACGG